MKLIEILTVTLIITILASIGLPVIEKAYERAQWYFLVANSRNRSRLENALIDDPSKADQARLEFLLSAPLSFK